MLLLELHFIVKGLSIEIKSSKRFSDALFSILDGYSAEANYSHNNPSGESVSLKVSRKGPLGFTIDHAFIDGGNLSMLTSQRYFERLSVKDPDFGLIALSITQSSVE